jgi:hypothetical protein
MTALVDRAAARLLTEIHAPLGVVNTMGVHDNDGDIIRVFVDPSYWYRLESLPKTFDGFPVLVEKSSPTIPGKIGGVYSRR